jgi:hypothetical protein
MSKSILQVLRLRPLDAVLCATLRKIWEGFYNKLNKYIMEEKIKDLIIAYKQKIKETKERKDKLINMTKPELWDRLMMTENNYRDVVSDLERLL